MRRRKTSEASFKSERNLDPWNLVVVSVSPEDVFLLKTVAGRVDDIKGMCSLMQIVFEFDAVEAELGYSMVACLAQERASPALKSLVDTLVFTHSD